MRINLTIICLLLLTVPAYAVQPYTPVRPDPVLESWRWTSFPELKGRGLRTLAEDRDGNMWFGVDEGAVRYDGVNWTTFTSEDGLPDRPVRVFLAARDGRLYAGTGRGISRFEDGRWVRVLESERNFSWGVQQMIEASDGSIWAATRRGAVVLRGGAARLIYTSKNDAEILNRVGIELPVAVLPDEVLPAYPWGEGLGMEVYRSDDADPRSVINLLAGGPAEMAGIELGDHVQAVDGDPSVGLNATPIGTTVTLTVQRKGKLEPFEVAVTASKLNGSFRSFDLTTVCEDRTGAMWFGTWGQTNADGSQIARFDAKKGTPGDLAAWRVYTKEEGLDAAPGFPTILEKRDGTIWVSTNSRYGGISRFDGKQWTSTRLSEIGGHDINPSILEARDGTVWVGGARGYLHAYRNGSWTVYKNDKLVPEARIVALLEASDGALWLALWGHEAIRIDVDTDRWATNKGLLFEGEQPDGTQWFLSQDNGVVRVSNAGKWDRFGLEDGLMDAPHALLITRSGALWAAGSHRKQAATAEFDGSRWSLRTHPELSWSVDYRAVLEAKDGALWFGAAVDRKADQGQVGGILHYDGESWGHTTPDEGPPSSVYGIGQTLDGSIWLGTVFGLVRFDGSTWEWMAEPQALARGFSIDDVFTTSEGLLWFGHRSTGVFHFDGHEWQQFTIEQGLADNQIRSITESSDGSIWAATRTGISRYDGSTWVDHALPRAIDVSNFVSLTTSDDGSIWVNQRNFGWSRRGDTNPALKSEPAISTLRYKPDTTPPETEVTFHLEEVSQPGNATFEWIGSDPWRNTPADEIRYAWRLDDGSWSAFSREKSKVLLEVATGDHTFEVKARDRDFNEDPTPASIAFTVIPPVYQQGWFIGMVILFVGGIGFQTSRVVRRDRRLRESNSALSDANNELFQVNVDLQREQVLERLRGQAQGMQSSEDITGVTAGVFREVEELGLSVERASINVFDEKAETIDVWATTSEGELDGPHQKSLARGYERLVEVAKSGEDLLYRHREGEELRKIIRYSIDHGTPMPEWDGIPEEDWPKERHSYYLFFPDGWFLLNISNPLLEKDLAVVKRFAEVFGFTYSRFRDLKEKEAQNRQLISEAALERVRSSVTSMVAAADLGGVVEQMLKELETSGVDFDLCVINIIDEGAGVRRQYGATPQGWSGQVEMPLSEVSEEFLGLWREGKPVAREVDDALAEACFETRSQMGVTGEMVRPTAVVDAPFAYGTLSLQTHKTEGLSEGDIEVVAEFARVVALGYARYLDFENLERQNQELQRDRAVERIRGEVQSMEKAEDFERVLSLLTEDLKTVGLDFESCEIDVLDEPVENPTMAYFEAHGFRYTTYKLDPQGDVASRSYNVPAPLPTVIEQTVARFIEGEPWQGTSEGQAIVEVPAGSYGRLRLTESGRDTFEDDEVVTLREFAAAVALGYARYLDIREIQLNTERKSKFLASMSHELRTPMNAIKGFTNLVLGRRSENLNDQQRENLGKVSQASDHLLGMIDDLLDLSKIEAGSMDVNATMFNVGELIASACDTVSPLIQEGVELKRDLADDIGEANTDKARLQQMVINLLSNAIKFTVSGSVTVSASQVDGQLVLSVTDTGKGIPADELPTIFDEYRQAEGSESSVQKGTGLGLSITKKFAELLGGTIGVESEVGKGSTFTVRVPTSYQPPEA